MGVPSIYSHQHSILDSSWKATHTDDRQRDMILAAHSLTHTHLHYTYAHVLPFSLLHRRTPLTHYPPMLSALNTYTQAIPTVLPTYYHY
mmetsp:Transcript_26491/g.67818  ORF Transcript_26491/g.67818 Transcript_26491/m.67818 type:complete len:89 (-) Transcript_26491:508-774(-)